MQVYTGPTQISRGRPAPALHTSVLKSAKLPTVSQHVFQRRQCISEPTSPRCYHVPRDNHRRAVLRRCQPVQQEPASPHPFPEEEDFSLLSTRVADLTKELVQELRGCSIYVVGMMGSGKSTAPTPATDYWTQLQLLYAAIGHSSMASTGYGQDAETGAPTAVVMYRLLLALKKKIDDTKAEREDRKNFTIVDTSDVSTMRVKPSPAAPLDDPPLP
ncbi:uncharacterized protein HaLaN_25684 [Haematococcus lacustris]|uniref:Uncharacterized protein n=1 Tax=Haematococcus lacustris TaxID=44745 RepID=A0A6A0A3R4_HAELA|nr:uncharacterized protein HaLaN_25684 [Haematococcus lacustris]